MDDAFLTIALKPDGSFDHCKMVADSPLVDFIYDFQGVCSTAAKLPERE